MDSEKAIAKIKDYRAAAATFPVLREVIKQFDGKVYNIKLDKALKAAFDGAGFVYVHNAEKYIDISFSARGSGSSGYRCILSMPKDKAFSDGKRINAVAMIENARETRAQLLRRAFEIESYSENAEEIKSNIDKMEKALCSYIDAIPYEVRELFDLRPHRAKYY